MAQVCLARQGWHCRSLPTAFPPKRCGWRVCESVYTVRCAPGAGRTTLYLMALQPTKRGAWCRQDRKKSYRPGDVTTGPHTWRTPTHRTCPQARG